MSTHTLLEYNPWWKDKMAIELDPQIQAWNNSNLQWDSKSSHTFSNNDHVYSLRGPRQVGKTTLIKLQIQQLLKENVPQWNILYYSFETENSPNEIVNVINKYFDNTRHEKNNQHFIYLDEISNIINWQKAIKKLKDQGKLVKCTIIVTGSHSVDLRRATELMPGRRGIPTNENLDKIFLPMKFGEFVSTLDKQIDKKIKDVGLFSTQNKISRICKLVRDSIEGNDCDDIFDLFAFQNELDAHLDTYLLTGGMPPTINEFLNIGFIHNSTYQIYVDSILGNLRRIGKDVTYTEQIIPNILKSITTQISWGSLTKDTDIGSHHTAEEYAKIMSEMFILSIFYRYNSANNRPKYDSLKKIYFQDPFFMHALNGYINQSDSYEWSVKLLDVHKEKVKAIEQVVASHCIQMASKVTRNLSGFFPTSSVFYWKGKTSKEIDFIIRDKKDSLIPIEVKYQNQIKKHDQNEIINFKKITKTNKGIIVTKKDLKIEKEVVFIPASLFLLLI